jgi:hypothetical protein
MYQVPRIYGAGLIVVLLGFGLNRLLVLTGRSLFFWSGEERGRAEAFESGKPFRLALPMAAAAFAILMAVGIYEIVRAEAILNDPSVIPEYRVWTE